MMILKGDVPLREQGPHIQGREMGFWAPFQGKIRREGGRDVGLRGEGDALSP